MATVVACAPDLLHSGSTESSILPVWDMAASNG